MFCPKAAVKYSDRAPFATYQIKVIAIGSKNPTLKYRVLTTLCLKLFKLPLFAIIHRKITPPKSKAAGILNKVAADMSIPPARIFFGVGLFCSDQISKNAPMIGPIMNISALAMLPSKRGNVVSKAKIVVATLWSFSFLGKRRTVSFQKRNTVTICQIAKIALNQNK